jgi:single-strand DNA-binding protein
MAGETTITVIGNLVSDPELSFVPSGSAVANFTIASTPKVFDRQSNDYKDGETLFLRSSVWRETAENVAESLTKGMRVIASGVLKSRSYENDGEKRTAIEFDVQEIGPSLRFANAKVNRTQRNGNSSGFGGQDQPPTQQVPAGVHAIPGGGYGAGGDPWATPQPTFGSEPPF